MAFQIPQIWPNFSISRHLLALQPLKPQTVGRLIDSVWTAEGWGTDAVSPLAFLAARTNKIRLGSGILQVTARAPAMTAMTAMTLDVLSQGRFILGLGASGPLVVEGLHGLRFDKPITRVRETIDIIQQAFSGERLEHQGLHYTLPVPNGEGKGLRLAFASEHLIPIYLATLSPAGLELTGELADGWLGTSFMPEAAEVHLIHLRNGAERAGRMLKDIDLCAGGMVQFGDDVEGMVAARRKQLAFTLGAMGSAKTNFYFNAYARAGYQDACEEVRDLWCSGHRREAETKVPEAMALGTGLFGTDSMVRERIRAYRDVGITTLRLDPQGSDFHERLDCLAHVLELIQSEIPSK